MPRLFLDIGTGFDVELDIRWTEPKLDYDTAHDICSRVEFHLRKASE